MPIVPVGFWLPSVVAFLLAVGKERVRLELELEMGRELELDAPLLDEDEDAGSPGQVYTLE